MGKISTFIIGLLIGIVLAYSTKFVIDFNQRVNVLERQNLLLKTKVLEIEKDYQTLAEFIIKYFSDIESKSVYREI